jgi:hypothetical protein
MQPLIFIRAALKNSDRSMPLLVADPALLSFIRLHRPQQIIGLKDFCEQPHLGQ